MLAAGDVVAFPFGTGHQLGAGAGGRLITPVEDLPPKPWRELPILRYGDGAERVRLLCGYLHCDALDFRPLRNALPTLLHVRTAQARTMPLAARDDRADRRRSGQAAHRRALHAGAADRDHLHRAAAAPDHRGAGRIGRLACGAGRPALGRCLALIHDDPRRDWSVQELAAASGLSRSALTERFETMLDTSPMRYVRDWRLYLASVALSTTTKALPASPMRPDMAPKPPSTAPSRAPTACRPRPGGREQSKAEARS